MKIYKLILTLAILLSGYLGYNNFLSVDVESSFQQIMSMEEAAEAAKERLRPSEEPEKEEETDYGDLILKIIETASPLLVPYLASRRKKDKQGEPRTLDDDIGRVAENMGVSKAFVRGKLGLGDRRKKQTNTAHRRRAVDKK